MLIQHLFLFGLFTLAKTQESLKQSCIDRYLRKNPQILQRFGRQQIEALCKMDGEWEQAAISSKRVSQDDLITRPQKLWLNSLRSCIGTDCLKVIKKQSQAKNAGLMEDTTRDGRALRKEIRMMSDSERDRFHRAINVLKTDFIDGTSKYDLLVVYHTPQESPEAHYGPAFLPFHRELLKQLELALRSVDPDVSLPYWDSTLDSHLPDARDSILWTELFFGTSRGPVTSGPYANWNTINELSFIPGVRRLFRDVGSSPFGGMMTPADVDFVLSRTNYNQLTQCVDPTFELVHGTVHMFVGGFMADMAISPSDPTFFWHHSFIDYLWERFRTTRQSWAERETQYPEQGQSCNNFHYASSSMRPFPLRNIDGMSNSYTRDLYTYSPSPICTSSNPECGSPYLHCDTRSYRCMSKIREGGNCTGFQGTSVCYNGQCQRNTCVRQTWTTTQRPWTTTQRPWTTTTQRPWTTTTQRPWTTTTQRPWTTTTQRPWTTTQPWTTTTQNWWETTTRRPWTTTQSPWDRTTWSSRTTSTPRPNTIPWWTTTQQSWTTTQEPWPQQTTTEEWSLSRRFREWKVGNNSWVWESWTSTSNIGDNWRGRGRRRHTRRRAKEEYTATPQPQPQYSVGPPSSESHSRQNKPSTVYFTITVQRGSGYYKEAVPDAQIKSYGLNVPTGYTQTMQGWIMDSSRYPSYSGAAIVPVRNPDSTSYFSIVDAAIEVKDSKGRLCEAQCYNDGTQEYKKCSSQVRLSLNKAHSDPIPFAPTQPQALLALWLQDGPRKRRSPDYLIFQCRT